MRAIAIAVALLAFTGGSSCGGGISDITPEIYVFSTAAHNGGLGGRTGADALCAARKASQLPDSRCTHIHALITVSASDQLADMPTHYGVPQDRPLLSPSERKIADDWADLLNQGIDQSLQSAQVTTDTNWWSGSNPSGLDLSHNCSQWNDPTGSSTGFNGDTNATNLNWMTVGFVICSSTRPVLCLCW